MNENVSVKNELRFVLLKALTIGILLALIFTVILGICRCSDDSMSPAFKDGDIVFYYKLQSEYDVSEAVVIKIDGKAQVRRIIARSGDEVNFTKDGLEINGYLQNEDIVSQKTLPYVNEIEYPITVPENQYFVLGDNRLDAEDSRVYGTVKSKDIKGRVMTLIRRRGL